MGKTWLYFLFLLWFAYLIVSSILLFTHGFLLSRVTQELNATCVQYSNNCTSQTSNNYDCDINNKLHFQNASRTCLPQRARIVLIVIDALRYDFAKYNPTIANPKTYQNKLPIIDKLLKDSHTSRLYKFIADPPTTTMQRLKALTTGSLPTFIDAGSNFASYEINEDNIIDQLKTKLRDIVFMGDDTWDSLYPNRFKRSYPYPSFNVFDLDTVDDGVISNLFPELEKKDWDLLIAHFLGVDHCGHRYGPFHSEMSRKLTQMNEVIENVVSKLDDDTMLFLIGDHGMTITGDHGGDSEDEVTSAMFVYSKMGLNPTNEFDTEIIKQIDLVPTLATVLGIPIPHSNLGSLVMDALPPPNSKLLEFPEWYLELIAIWSNIQQITKYITEYALSSETFSQEKLQNLHERYEVLNAQGQTVNDEVSYKAFVTQGKEYKTTLRKMCEEVWIKFDSLSMSRGLVLSFMAIFLMFIIVTGIPSNQLPLIIKSSFLPCSYAVLLFATGISVFCFYFNLVDDLVGTIYFATGLVSVFMLSILIIQNWELISVHWYEVGTKRTTTDLLFRLLFVLSWCGLLSNSYIVEEGNVSMFLLFTTIILNVYDCNLQKKLTFNLKHKWNWSKVRALSLIVLAGILIRLSSLYFKCREEQPQCLQYLHAQGMKPGFRSDKADYLITLVTVALFITATRNWLRSCGNLAGLSPTVLLANYAPTVIVVTTGGYWILRVLTEERTSKIASGFQTDSLALSVYGFIIFGILSIIIKPLCIYVIPKSDVTEEEKTIPQIFNRVKGLFNQEKTESNSNVPIVYGLATVYSAAFIIISIYVCLLLILLLGDVIAPSAVLLYFSATSVLILSSLSRIDKDVTTAQLFEVPNSYILTWMLISLYFFYGSGHQATFPSISWEAAFIGNSGNFNSNLFPALLVIINTFGGFILMGLTLPLLFIAPFTLHVMFPSMCNKKEDSKLSQDISRGEILLYEKDEVMFNSVFTISCKYIILHAVRISASMLAATIHCRHLMVWKIFAPKLIFEAIGIIVTLVSVLFGYLLLIRVNYQVDKLISKLNKENR